MATKIDSVVNEMGTPEIMNIKDGLNYWINIQKDKEKTLEIVKKQPFYTGEDFTLPSSLSEGKQTISNMEKEMEKMDPKSNKYKKELLEEDQKL